MQDAIYHLFEAYPEKFRLPKINSELFQCPCPSCKSLPYFLRIIDKLVEIFLKQKFGQFKFLQDEDLFFSTFTPFVSFEVLGPLEAEMVRQNNKEGCAYYNW